MIGIVQYMEEQNKTKHAPFGDDGISLIELNPSPKYPHTNSPDWFSYISLENKLRDFAKRSKQFPLGDHLNKSSWYFLSG